MDKLIKYTTIIYALLFFAGYFSKYLYFSLFGLNVNDYLSTTEILLSFLSLITDNIFVLYFLFAISFSFLAFQSDYLKLTNKLFSNRFYQYYIIIFSTIILIALLFVIFLFTKFEAIEKRNSYAKVFIPLLFLFLIPTIYLMVLKKNEIRRSPILLCDNRYLEDPNDYLSLFLSQRIKQFMWISLYLFVLVLISINQIYKVDKILSKKDYSRVISFQYRERIVRFQEFPILIESTSDYLFTYYKKSGFVSVYNKKNIEDLDFFVNEGYNDSLIASIDSLIFHVDSVKQKRVFILY